MIVLDNETAIILVQARDDDEEPIVFTWIVGDRRPATEDVLTFPETTSDGTLWLSRLTVHRDQMVPNSTVLCLISDGEAGSTFEWRAEFP